MALTGLQIGIVVLYCVMAVRAFQSASVWDRLLGAACLAGSALLFLAPIPYAGLWLVGCAVAYLISQVITSARPLSRGLPILAAVLVGALVWLAVAT